MLLVFGGRVILLWLFAAVGDLRLHVPHLYTPPLFEQYYHFLPDYWYVFVARWRDVKCCSYLVFQIKCPRLQIRSTTDISNKNYPLHQSPSICRVNPNMVPGFCISVPTAIRSLNQAKTRALQYPPCRLSPKPWPAVNRSTGQCPASDYH